MIIVSIHQPNYIPWLGYFYKIYQSDIFVFLEDVQYSNKGMHNYNYIKTGNGLFRIKIPVYQTLGDKISEVSTKDELGWKQKHLTILKSNYANAPYFEEVISDFKGLLETDSRSLSELNKSIIRFICNKLNINCCFVNSSDLKISSSKEGKILDICSALKADIYFSGTGAKFYQKEEDFKARGIQLKYSEFHPFPYNQLWDNFNANVTAIDYFMNCGYDWSTVLKHQNL